MQYQIDYLVNQARRLYDEGFLTPDEPIDTYLAGLREALEELGPRLLTMEFDSAVELDRFSKQARR